MQEEPGGQARGYNEEGTRNKRGGKSTVVIYLDEHLETIAYGLFKHRTAQNSERAAPEKVTSSQTKSQWEVTTEEVYLIRHSS